MVAVSFKVRIHVRIQFETTFLCINDNLDTEHIFSVPASQFQQLLSGTWGMVRRKNGDYCKLLSYRLSLRMAFIGR